jgi:hypothetical protein
MKQLIVIVATIALAVFIGSLVIGSDANSMKTQIKGVNDAQVTKYTEMKGW